MNIMFGRDYLPDERDYQIAYKSPCRQRKTWRIPSPVLNQKQTPQCVGYAICNWLRAQPVRQYLDPYGIYHFAQFLDEWEGTEYDGTSVRAGLKAIREFACISEFYGTKDVDVLASSVLNDGPVVVGTIWTQEMCSPEEYGGFLVPGDEVLGGHAWLVLGCDDRKQELTMLNSWGPDWGENGRAMVTYEDMQTLLDADGECWIGTELRGTAL